MATASGILTSAGANYILNNGLPASLWMAIGDGTSTPAASQTALDNELARKSLATNSISGDTWTGAVLYAPTDAENESIAEVGIFSAASGGTMLFRATYGVTYSKASKQFLSTLTAELQSG